MENESWSVGWGAYGRGHACRRSAIAVPFRHSPCQYCATAAAALADDGPIHRRLTEALPQWPSIMLGRCPLPLSSFFVLIAYILISCWSELLVIG
jgi:hypothetical protein